MLTVMQAKGKGKQKDKEDSKSLPMLHRTAKGLPERICSVLHAQPFTNCLHAGPYKDTVNLPLTKFNMRANSTQREPELQKFWEKNKIYEQLLKENPGVCLQFMLGSCFPLVMHVNEKVMFSFLQDVFTLHDGPPYANGCVCPLSFAQGLETPIP
jgi:hypothetical protein